MVIVLVAIGILVMATSHHYGFTWDEPYYFKATTLHMEWIGDVFQQVWKGRVAGLFEDSVISQYWHWDPYHVPHPPFSRILSGLTWWGTAGFLGEVRGFRLSTGLFFLVLLGTVWVWTNALSNGLSAWVALLATLAMPHLFGHAHFAMTDIPIATLWILTAYAFWRGLTSTAWSMAFGLFLGFSLATKFPGFLIPIPLILWSFLYRETRPRIYRNVYAAVFLAPFLFVLLYPFLWHFPFPRILEFVYSSTTRLYRPDTSFVSLFFNKIYFSHQLPWYYPFVMVGLTIPVSILPAVLLGIGTVLFKSRENPSQVLPLFCGLFLLLIPLLPGAVIHDGVRLLLPVFPFLAIMAGLGFDGLLKRIQKIAGTEGRRPGIAGWVTGGGLGLMLLPAFYSLVMIHPFELSYYNGLVGGIRGAYSKGLEVTYLQEVISPEFLEGINRMLPQGARLNGTKSQFMLREYQDRGNLRKDIRLVKGTDCDYYLVLMRRSSIREYFDPRPEEKAMIDRWGKEGREPVMARTIEGVPLLLLYKVD